MPATAVVEELQTLPKTSDHLFADYPRVDVPVLDSCTKEEMSRLYLSGLGSPVVVRNAMTEWPASRKWTFDFFAQQHGDRRYLTNSNLNSKTGWRRLRFDDYILYCVNPALSPLGAIPTDRPFYSAFPLINQFPELLADVRPAAFADNIYSALQGDLADWFQQVFVWLFIGPAGTVTDLHVDHFMMHTYSAQFTGYKKFLFFSPTCLRNLEGPAARKAVRDLNERPGIRYDEPVTVHEAIVGPGEIVVFPAGWGHHVTALEPSISLSVNFVDSSNFLDHILSISRNLHVWAKRTHHPNFIEANQCAYGASDFAWLPESRLTSL